jgi:hypothetical protein
MKEPVKEVEKVVSQPQQIRHIEKGTINSNNSKFTDAELLNGLYNYKVEISMISVDLSDPCLDR